MQLSMPLKWSGSFNENPDANKATFTHSPFLERNTCVYVDFKADLHMTILGLGADK